MLEKLDLKPIEANAFWNFNELSSAEFEALAEKWLVEGLGDSELSVAAFDVPKIRNEATPLVKAAFSELGLPNLSKKQSGWLIIHASLERLLDRRWSIIDAACEIVNFERELDGTPLFEGKDPHMENIRSQPRYRSNGDKLFAGEACRVNGIIAAYFSKDDYHYDANKSELSYNEHLNKIDSEVEKYILSEAKLTWKHYFSLNAHLPDEYKILKKFL